MRRKINKRLIQTAALAIVATLLLTVAVCYRSFQNQVMEDLRGYAKLLGGLVTEAGSPFDSLDDSDLQEEHIRITLVAQDGTVLTDTYTDAKALENHGSRPEIQSAMRMGEGSIVRKSDTLDTNTYYYAMKLENGQILRVAKEADSIYRIMESAVPWLLLFMSILFALCLVLSHFLSEGIMRPIRLIAQDVDNIQKTETYEELKPYILAIKNQHDDVLQNALLRQEFTANVSHELKTPLAAISGYAELIENGMAADQSEVQRFSKEIHSNANRLLTLINDVIRLSELDAQGTEEMLEPVNLRDMAQTCVNMLQINAQKHHVTLNFEGENAVIMATRQMVEEILYNLCDNAIRYNKEGGSVSVIVRDRLNTALLIVKDTGIGIPKEHQERVFERFYRVDKGRSKSTGGTGLGLAIVKHILPRLEAGLSLESESGVGTEITISFPALRDARLLK